jgi:hypothetical protein
MLNPYFFRFPLKEYFCTLQNEVHVCTCFIALRTELNGLKFQQFMYLYTSYLAVRYLLELKCDYARMRIYQNALTGLCAHCITV